MRSRGFGGYLLESGSLACGSVKGWGAFRVSGLRFWDLRALGSRFWGVLGLRV